MQAEIFDKAERVSEIVKELEVGFSGLDDATRSLLTDAAHTYAWLSASCEELERQIDEEGYYAEGVHGQKANPAIDIYSKLATRKHSYLAKIEATKRRAESDDADALTEFLRQ